MVRGDHSGEVSDSDSDSESDSESCSDFDLHYESNSGSEHSSEKLGNSEGLALPATYSDLPCSRPPWRSISKT